MQYDVVKTYRFRGSEVRARLVPDDREHEDEFHWLEIVDMEPVLSYDDLRAFISAMAMLADLAHNAAQSRVDSQQRDEETK